MYRWEDEFSEEEYLQLIMATYLEAFPNDPDLTADLIRADIKTFEDAEQYEACARLKIILENLE
mgnify:CR=1 FL=1|jgi:hypothetical protein|tara:strand:+ start:664 stop:855 length:192 start_codon:yes stop_codon:yes gene_type:complete